MISVLEVEQGPQADVEDRRGKIGASDIPVISGTLPWRGGKLLELYRYHLGEVDRQPDDPKATGPTAVGNLLEEPVAELTARALGVELARCPRMIPHPENPWAVASPDRVTVEADPRIVEIKVVGMGSARFWGEGQEDVPPYVRDQVLWQKYVTQNPRPAIVGALLGGTNFRVYTVAHDEERIRELVTLALSFLQCIERREPPPVDGSDEAKEWLRAQYPTPTAPLRRLSDSEADAVFAFREAKRMHDAAKDAFDEARNRLVALIGEAEGVEGPWGRITYKAQNRRPVTEWQAVAEELRGYVPADLWSKACDANTRAADPVRYLRPAWVDE